MMADILVFQTVDNLLYKFETKIPKLYSIKSVEVFRKFFVVYKVRLLHCDTLKNATFHSNLNNGPGQYCNLNLSCYPSRSTVGL